MKDMSEAELKECGNQFDESCKRDVQGEVPSFWLERLEEEDGVFSRSRQSRRQTMLEGGWKKGKCIPPFVHPSIHSFIEQLFAKLFLCTSNLILDKVS